MAFDRSKAARFGNGWGVIAALVEADGSHNHPMMDRLSAPKIAVRDIADAIHALCMLHGRQPGVIDHAYGRPHHHPAAQAWLESAMHGFAVERALLAKLASVAGPLPSTPGQAESEAAVAAQRHALAMLAQSDRTGCAMGAAVALVIDWGAIRGLLESAASRFGVVVPDPALPSEDQTATVIALLAENQATERAMAFGVQQVLAQHRGLWDLLDARASARDRH